MQGSQRSNIASFMVMDVMARAAAKEAMGEEIIHMEVGQPATPAPNTARAAARHSLDHDSLGYTLALGRSDLRQRIAEHYLTTYSQEIEAARVVITSGSSAGFVLAFLALFDSGQHVALPSPGYPCYRHILTALGQEPVLIDTGPETRWMPTVAALETAHRKIPLSGLVIASPANPTGTMITPDRLRDIAEFCAAEDIWLVSDEIYHGITYEHAATTALAVSDRALVINSFSKFYSMTGWRIGWMVVPAMLVPVIERLAQNFYISPPTIAQVAATAAFDGLAELQANRDVYAANRALLLAGLKEVGLGSYAPGDGAFYLYVDITVFSDDSQVFARQMLDEIQVAVTPGLDFDSACGQKFIRFCYAGARGDVVRAVERLKAWPRLKQA